MLVRALLHEEIDTEGDEQERYEHRLEPRRHEVATAVEREERDDREQHRGDERRGPVRLGDEDDEEADGERTEEDRREIVREAEPSRMTRPIRT